MPSAAQHRGRNFLIHRVVFGEQNAKRTPCLFDRVPGDERGPVRGSRVGQRCSDGLEQLDTGHGFLKVGCDSELAAAIAVAFARRRGQEHDRRPRQIRLSADFGRQIKPVPTRHLYVTHDEPVRHPRVGSVSQTDQRIGHVVDVVRIAARPA